MVDEGLLLYVKKQIANKKSEQELRDLLTSKGWSKQNLDMAFHEAGVVDDVPSPTPGPRAHNMWDTFEHVLLFISLYIFAISFALLVHVFVDRWVPKTETININSYASTYMSTKVRSYLSALIVSYPLFAFLFLKINKKNLKNPSLRFLRSRKTLIYLTLVVTFVISLVSIVSIVYSFLNGGVTANFVLHFLVTMLISLTIFGYLMYQVKEDRHYA